MYISIIMPVYNSGKYIDAAIDSILKQKFRDWELIIIDDGSTDGTSEKIDDYSHNDNRIVVFHRDNAGICASRNFGIQKAKGEYVAFCDHDDYFAPNMLQDLSKVANRYNPDIIKCGCQELYLDPNDNVYYTRNITYADSRYFREDELVDAFNYRFSLDYMGYIWDGIYKRDVLQNAGGFNEKMRFGFEDEEIQFKMYPIAKGIYYSKEVLYTHNIRNNFSTSQKHDDNKIESMILTVKESIKCVDQIGVKSQYSYFPAMFVARGLANSLIELSSSNDKISISEMRATIKSVANIPVFNEHMRMKDIFEVGMHKKKWGSVMLLYRLKLYSLLIATVYMNKVRYNLRKS